MPRTELERYCELIAALKLRTTSKAGRHLSTGRAIELMEDYGVETAQGLVKVPKGLLRCPTVNRYLSLLRLDQPRLLREPPTMCFQAEHSNDCWQFDMSSSSHKHIDKPDWIEPTKGEPTLMLFSVADDRSGVGYQEYRCVDGEDAESALHFLFNAMTTARTVRTHYFPWTNFTGQIAPWTPCPRYSLHRLNKEAIVRTVPTTVACLAL